MINKDPELNPAAIRYLVRQGVVSPSNSKGGRGNKRLFTERDLWIIDLVVKMRQAGFDAGLVKRNNLTTLSIQNYPIVGVFYAHDDAKHKFAAYWDTKSWTITTGLMEIIDLLKTARDSRNCIFLSNIDKNKRSDKQQEVANEQPKP